VRTAADVEQRRVTALALWAVSSGASVWLIDLQPYEFSRVAGIVLRLRLDLAQGQIDATVTDGTAEVRARWPIRRPTPELAVKPGRAVLLEGIAVVGRDGELVLKDPAFEIVDFPESPDDLR
jgi:hypothetical protein